MSPKAGDVAAARAADRQQVLQPIRSSGKRSSHVVRKIFLTVAAALLVVSVWSLSSGKHHLKGKRSQFEHLPERYVICSAPSHGPLHVASSNSQIGSIYTGDEQSFADDEGFTQCVAVEGSVIKHVGTEDEVLNRFCGHSHPHPPPHGKKRRGPRSNKAVRLNKHSGNKHGALGKKKHCDIRRLRPGQTLFPGFHDAHGHILDYGWSRTVANLVGSTSVDEVISRLEDYVRSRPHLMAFALADDSAADTSTDLPWVEGIGWDQTKWSPAVFPTAADLSRSTLLRRFPIMLRRVDVHAVWLSEVGLNMTVHGAKGFPASPKDDHKVEGGLVIRDDSGQPTGILIDNAMNFAYQVVPEWTDAKRKIFLDAATEGLLRVGITAVGDAATDRKAAEFYKEMDAEGQLRFRIYSMLACPPGERRCADRIEQVRPAAGGREDQMFTLRAVKLFNDGALGSWGSAMWEDYSDKSGERGLLLIPEQELPSLIEYWLERGWQVCTHAIGDRANTLTLDAYEAYLRSHPDVKPSSLRPRIEHAQLIKPSDLGRFADLRVIASMQPTHCTSDMATLRSVSAASEHPLERIHGNRSSMRTLVWLLDPTSQWSSLMFSTASTLLSPGLTPKATLHTEKRDGTHTKD